MARRAESIGDGRGYANAATAVAGLCGSSLTPELAAIKCPVTLIGGENDALCPRKAADILLEALPRATYREIPGAGHLMNADNPDVITAALRDALSQR